MASNLSAIVLDVYDFNDAIYLGKQIYQTNYEMMDGWMACDLTSFSTVFQSYQEDGELIMEGCVQGNPVCD